MARSFRDTWAALKDRRMLYMLLLGMASGLPFALTYGTLQAWMTDVNIDLKTIGLFAFLRLPYSLKFLWSPLMDRYSLPFLDRRRSWAVITQLAISGSLVAMAFTDPATQILRLLILTLAVSFFSASQDIVLDAYRREVLSDEELGLGVGVFVNGYLIAFRYISGALAILLATYFGWSQVYLLMAALMGIFAVLSCWAPALRVVAAAPQTLREAFWGPLKEFFARPGALTILAFVILYKLGDQLALSMTVPYILQLGFTKPEYVAIAKVWGPIATFIGGFVGGHFVMKLGIIRSLWFMGILQAVATANFALLMLTGKNSWVLGGVVGFENFAIQMGTAAYAAYMGSITNVKFTATQYALFSSLMQVSGTLLASRTGDMAAHLGWINFFLVCALAALPGLFLIPILQAEKISPWQEAIRKLLIGVTVSAGLYAFVVSARDIALMFLR